MSCSTRKEVQSFPIQSSSAVAAILVPCFMNTASQIFNFARICRQTRPQFLFGESQIKRRRESTDIEVNIDNVTVQHLELRGVIWQQTHTDEVREGGKGKSRLASTVTK